MGILIQEEIELGLKEVNEWMSLYEKNLWNEIDKRTPKEFMTDKYINSGLYKQEQFEYLCMELLKSHVMEWDDNNECHSLESLLEQLHKISGSKF